MVPILAVVAALASLLVACLAFYCVTQKQTISALRSQVEYAERQAKLDIAEMKKSFESKKQKLNQRHFDELASERAAHKREMQGLREHIEGRRESLLQKDEKELLVDVMVALEGYGGRLDRLESGLSVARVAERIETLSSEFGSLFDGMSQSLEGRIEKLDTSIAESMRTIDVSQLMERLDSIQASVEGARGAADEISEFLEDNNVAYLSGMISSLQDDVDGIESDVDDIKSSIGDPYAYNSISDGMDQLKQEVEYAKSAAEEAKDAAESARCAIESHF